MPVSTSKATAIDNSTTSSEDNKKDISQEYETLNKKCDTVITKIRKRKQKQKQNTH